MEHDRNVEFFWLGETHNRDCCQLLVSIFEYI